jgi:hypothetical protein
MTHLDVENLTSDYLEGLLGAEVKRELESHLRLCPACLEMVEDVRQAMELCQAAPALEPAPWLVSRIMLATVGERRPSWAERLAAYIRPVFHSRLAYGIAMAVFSFSIIVNAAGISLRKVTVGDLNPLTWWPRADRAANLYLARLEQFASDLRVVYEVESRIQQLRSQAEEERKTPKEDPPAGGSSKTAPLRLPALAGNAAWVGEPFGHTGPGGTNSYSTP